MSFTFTVMMMLLGSSVVIAFVLQPSKEEPAASANSPVFNHRCQGQSLLSIRKDLLSSLNLQVEPQLPAGGLDGVREKWRDTISNIAPTAGDAGVPAVSQMAPEDGNSTSMKCCSVASEIFMTDLGWDNWVIHPASLTIVQCALCNGDMNTMQCLSSHTNVQNADSQVPCCQLTSQKMVPVVYIDEFNTVTISSLQLPSSCGCEHGNIEQPSDE